MHQLQTLALNLLNHDGENLLLTGLILRQENQTSTVFSLFGYRDALKKNKLVWNLQQDAGSVAGLAVSALGATMSQILQHFQCIVNQLMTFTSVDIHHHTYAARVVLVGTVVQSISLHVQLFLYFTYQSTCKSTKLLSNCSKDGAFSSNKKMILTLKQRFDTKLGQIQSNCKRCMKSKRIKLNVLFIHLASLTKAGYNQALCERQRSWL